MQVVAVYIFVVTCSIVVALAVRWCLDQFPLTIKYKEEIVGGIVWILTLYYFRQLPNLISVTIEKDLDSWELAVGLPWTICALGLPTVLPRIWAAVLNRLRDSAFQWLLTVIAAILSYIIFIMAQWFADYTIQNIMQTHPDQFPGAQRMLTAMGAVWGWIAMFYFIATLITLITPMVKIRSTGRPFLSMTAALPVLIALLIIMPNALFNYQQALSTDKHERYTRQGSVLENLILWTSFMSNRVVEGILRSETGEIVQQAHLACRNLPPEVYVAFVHPDEVAPDKVVVAEPRSGEIAEGGLAYNYRLSACENSINPNGVK